MCSWCWGFKPVLSKLKNDLPSDIQVKYLLGGLAKDSHIPMSLDMQSTIQQTWHNIQHEIPGINFNFDFWTNNIPRRSTYPACRAVMAAKKQKPEFEFKIIEKIQRAYYLEAKNPSDLNVLINCAKELDLNIETFTDDISSTETQNELQNEICLSRELGTQGFPSLILNHNNQNYYIEIHYTNAVSMLNNINSLELNPC